MATKSCVQCGKAFTAKRSTAKYCSSTCRSKASLHAPVVVARSGRDLDAGPGLVEIHTRAELVEARADDSAMGAAALALARRIDDGAETGGILSQMVARLDVVLSTIKARAPQPDDPLTALRARAAAKRASW